MKIRSLRKTEIDEMCELIAGAFARNGVPADAIRRKLDSDPTFNLELNRVVEIDGRLAARIGINDREMYFKGDILRVGAIGGVCTAQAHQGKGLCRALLDDCTSVMNAHGFDVSLLFGEPAIYGNVFKHFADTTI